MDEPLSDFVIRPGRSAILWHGEVRGSVRFKVTSDLAVALTCETTSGCIAASGASREHAFEAQVKKRTRVKLRAQNVSGTRKTRGTLEVMGG